MSVISRSAMFRFGQPPLPYVWSARGALVHRKFPQTLSRSITVRDNHHPSNSFRRRPSILLDRALVRGRIPPSLRLISIFVARNKVNEMLRRLAPINSNVFSLAVWLAPGIAFVLALVSGVTYVFYESHCDRIPITGRKRFMWYDGEYDEEIGHNHVNALLKQV